MRTLIAMQYFLNNRRAQNLKSGSIKWYEGKLNPFAHSYPTLPTSPEPIEKFLAEINGCPETKSGYFKGLKAFYKFLSMRFGLANPMKQIRAPSCPKKIMATLEPHEMMQLLNLAENLRDKALLTLLVDTGARVGEIAGLRKHNIKESSIRVNGKTGERDIPISDETRRLLLALIATNGQSEYVFISWKGQPLDTNDIYYLVRRLMTAAGIQGPKLGPHRLRHAFGKGYLVNGGNLRSLQQLMGHANISTTEKYAALTLTDTIAKHHKFTPLRSAHAAAQESFWDTTQAIKEAEAILGEKG